MVLKYSEAWLCTVAYCIVDLQVLQKPTQENRQILIPASRAIAQAVTDLVAYGEILKGSDWIDPSDPTVIAENELLGAANSIEAAARKLALLKPRTGVGRVIN